jgi:hypothetical protein
MCDAAHEFQLAAEEEWSEEATVAAIARLEQAFSALSASWYEIRGKAAQDAAGGKPQRTEVLDGMAAEFARCARMCREARLVIGAVQEPGEHERRATPSLVAL